VYVHAHVLSLQRTHTTCIVVVECELYSVHTYLVLARTTQRNVAHARTMGRRGLVRGPVSEERHQAKFSLRAGYGARAFCWRVRRRRTPCPPRHERIEVQARRDLEILAILHQTAAQARVWPSCMDGFGPPQCKTPTGTLFGAGFSPAPRHH
jgi:hypothetical protein